MNTFYGEGTHFMGKEHIALGRNKNQYKKTNESSSWWARQQEIMLYWKRTNFMAKEQILWEMNTLYWEAIHFMEKENIALGRNKYQYKKQMSLKFGGPNSKKLKFLLFG